jgi:hypothetical protein
VNAADSPAAFVGSRLGLVPSQSRLYPLLGPRNDPTGRYGSAPLAQSVERFHGKEKVNGSIPLGGSADAEQAGGP